MLLVITSLLVGAYLALLVLGAIAQRQQQYDKSVWRESAALVVAVFTLAIVAIGGSDWIAIGLWAAMVTVQALGVRQARKYRREWLGWQDYRRGVYRSLDEADAHAHHACNEDCPGWTPYAGSAR